MALSSFCPECGAANPADRQLCMACQRPLLAAEEHQDQSICLLERYQIRREIGKGGFGAVHQAWDLQEERMVAIKQIHLHGLSSQEVIEVTDGFNREIQLLTLLNHARLPHIYEHFNDAEHWYLVMDFIDGQSLDSYVPQRYAGGLTPSSGLPLNEVLTMGLQLCEVLSYLHEQEPPVIFRDLKPSNIMRTLGGELVLIDFGIARRLKPGQEKDTMPFGSPGFAAPEQYGRGQTTPQADIYSLGALLYYLASYDDPAEHPFQFPSLPMVGQSETMTGLNKLIQHMVSLEASSRPATMREVQDELHRLQYLQAEMGSSHLWTPPISQTPPESFPPLVSFFPLDQQQAIFQRAVPQPRRFARRIILIGGGILAVGVFGGLWFKTARHFPPASVLATPVTQNPAPAQPEQVDPFSNSSNVVPISASADLHYLAINNPASSPQVQIIDVPGKHIVRTIQVQDYDVIPQIFWSRDATRFIAVVNGQGLVYDLKTGQNISIFHHADTPLASAAWSPDGQRLIGGGGTNVVTWSPTDALSYYVVRNQEPSGPGVLQLSAFAWSPDGRSFACVSPNDHYGNLFTPVNWKVEIGNSQTLTFEHSCSGVLVSNDVSYPDNQCLVWSPKGDMLALSFGMAIWLIQPFQDNASSLLVAYDSSLPDAQHAGNLTWSPDGTRLAQSYPNAGTVQVWDVKSKKSLSVTATPGPQYTGTKMINLAWSTDGTSITILDNWYNLVNWKVE